MDKLVLFVCTGNTCRSPMAEAWFKQCAADSELLGWRASSAGLCACSGERASTGAQAVMAEAGMDLSQFRSRLFSAELCRMAELVIPMTESHRRRILALCPEAAGKVRCLMEFAGGGEVADPFGGNVEEYRECFAMMRSAVETLVRKLKKTEKQ